MGAWGLRIWGLESGVMRGSKRLARMIHGSGKPPQGAVASSEAVPSVKAVHCLPCGKQRHTAMDQPGLAVGPARRAAQWRPAAARYGALSRLMAGVVLLAGNGCSWFPLVKYPPAPAVDEPAKVIDLTL
jgi:hypothetical protein